MGADSGSRIFYNRVKGDMEAAVAGLGYRGVVFARPSLLAGDRDSLQQPPRAAEKLSQGLMGLLRPVIPANLRAIDARDVALSLIEAVRVRQSGVRVLLSGALQRH